MAGAACSATSRRRQQPRSSPREDRHLQLAWFERLAKHARKLVKASEPVILAGDYNAIPTDLDVYKPERWVDDALFRPETRTAYARLLKQGWVDALRATHPGEKIYTFWDYFRNAYGRDAGLRIDHLLLNPALSGRLAAAGVDRSVRGWEKASDHAPAWIELSSGPRASRPLMAGGQAKAFGKLRAGAHGPEQDKPSEAPKRKRRR